MSKAIKSVTTKIGVDTTDFMKGFKEIDKQLKATQKTANELEKGLQIEYNPGRFVEAQKRVQTALKLTSEKAEAIRKKLKELESTGSVDTAGYEKLQSELAKTETNALKLQEQLEKLDKIKLDNTGKSFDEFGEKIEKAGQKVAGLSIAATGALVGLGALGKGAAADGASLDDLAQRTQIATEKLEELRYIALQTGVEEDQLQKALIKTRAAWADLESGTINNQTKALEKLGFEIGSFSSAENAFDGIISALSNMTDKTQQAAIANEIFGDKLTNNLIPYLNAGDEAIKQFKDEFALMPSLSAEQVEALAGMDDAFNRLNETLKYNRMQLGLALLPIMHEFTDFITDTASPAIQRLTEWFSGLGKGQQKAILGTLAVIAILSPLLILIGKVSYGVGALIKLFKNFNKQALITAGGVAALAGALTLGINIVADWNKMTTVEKILKGLALAALTAAAAVTVFHASWSMGAAVGVIAAAVTMGLGAINAAKKQIMGDDAGDTATTDYDVPSNYEIPKEQTTQNAAGSNNNNVYNDNSNIVVNIEKNDYMNEDDIIKAVNKSLKIARQSRS